MKNDQPQTTPNSASNSDSLDEYFRVLGAAQGSSAASKKAIIVLPAPPSEPVSPGPRSNPLGSADAPLHRSRPREEIEDTSGWLSRILIVASLLLGGFFLLKAIPGSPLNSQPIDRSAQHVTYKPTTEPQVLTRDIEDWDVGMRAMGTNPLREQVENAPEPDPETSRKLVIRMTKPSGRLLLVNLLRSIHWIDSVGAKEGGTFFLDLPEMGAVGDAHVEAILPCPPIQPGPGNVVTGTFAHEADPDTVILSVTFANGAYIKGVTDNHPFFSVRHNAFVDIGELREGDLVKINGGVTEITHMTSRFARPGEMLYNLETHNEHVYQVTTSGVLVHNSCVNRGGKFSDLDAMKKPGQVAHHMPQNAAGAVPRGRGPALGMTIDDHRLTRTFAGRGRVTNAADANLTPMQRLELDIADIRAQFGNKYDKGIQEMLDYAKTLPEFQ